MAELTVLEEKLAEVLGLAQAAQGATDKVAALTDEPDLSTTLGRMRDEADETERAAPRSPASSTARRPRSSTRPARPRPRRPR